MATSEGLPIEIIAERVEEAEDYDLAAEVMERIRRGEERTFTADEVRRDLGLDD